MAHIRFLPMDRTIDVPDGTTLLAAARRAGVPVRTRCGGRLGCLACKVRIIEGDGLAPPRPNEARKLGGLIGDGVRYSCQVRCRGSLLVEVPEDPLKAAVRRQLAKLKEERDEL
jgi:2Fe-2S ferredoxin